MRLAVYPKYKESGVQWLEEVPEHWEVRRSDGILISDRNQQNPETFKNEAVFHYSIPAVQEYGTGLVEEGESIASAKQRITEKCLLVSKLNPRKATICIAEPQQLKTLCSTEFVVLKSRKCDLNFLFYFSQAEIFRQGLDSKVQSVTRSHQRATPEDIYKFWSAWPPETEQTSIADFLDSETGRIDTLVAKKWALIGLLKEKRTALISRTVTRGLPANVAREFGLEPHARFKDSGVEWLGEVPEGWEVTQLGKKITLQRGVDITKDEQRDGCVPVVSSGGISSYHDTSITKGPGVVVGRKGTAGAVYYIDSDFWPHDTTLWVKEYRNNLPRYVYYKLCSMGLESFDTGSSNPTVNRNLVHPVVVSWPPTVEQTAIAAYLDRETARLDKLVEKVEAAITRLQEYRIALITAAVTGKIDVRTDIPTDIKEAC